MTVKDEIKAEDSPLVAQKPFNESFGLFFVKMKVYIKTLQINLTLLLIKVVQG